jgi:sialate O-acetylesterase
MKTIFDIPRLIGLAAMLATTLATAAEPLVRGQDRIDVPARGDGLCLHNLFQSGMVLQRDKPIRVWGWAEAGENVTVTFAGQSQSVTAGADRSWSVELPAQPASAEPRPLIIQGKNKKVELEDILIGDVWLLGGQSNMEFEIAKVDHGDLEIASANFPNIRLFTVPQQNGPDHKPSFPVMYQWSDWSKRHFRQGSWDVCSPENVRDMSAIGYVFARRIHMATQVPIGVMDVSRGGTCIETWLPMEVLKSIETPEVKSKLAEWDKKVAEFDPQKDLEARIKRFQTRAVAQNLTNPQPPADLQPGPALDMNRPGNCYASMIAPIAGFQIKGAIWHQGFNNAMQPNGHAMYYQVFAKMIGAWRAAFHDPQLPFGIISLCTAGDPQDQDDYVEKMADEGIYIRAVQYQTFLDLWNAGDKNIGYASSFDQRRSWYHPQIKIPVGERIARWALATQYGHRIRWLPPLLKEVKVETGKMILHLDSAAVPYHDGPIQGFAIAGADGKFQPARAEFLEKGQDSRHQPQYDRTAIVLTSPLVPEPRYYRHAWGRNPLANLKSADHTDLPFATQRNDTWTLADMFEIYTGKKPATPHVLDRKERAELDKALQAEDLRRRLAEANALLHANK